MSLAKRIASSTFSQVIGKFVIAALSIISVKLITEYLGTAGYGKYTVVYEIMSFSGIIADFGFFHIALREMGRNLKEMPKILGNILSMRLLLAVIASVITLAIIFGATDYDFATVKLGLIIALATSTIGLIGTTITAVIQVHLKMTYAALVQVIGKVVMIGVIWYIVVHDLGFLAVFWAGFMGSLVILILTYIYTLRYSKIYFGFDFALWKQLFRETYPMGLALIFYNITLRSPILMLDRIVKDDDLTGFYGVSQRIVEVLIFIPIAFMNSVLPTIAGFLKEKTDRSMQRLQQVIQYSFDFLNALSLPIIAGVFVLAPNIIKVISKAEFIQGAHILRILIFMIFFYYLSTLFGYILLAWDRQKLYMRANFWAAMAALASGFFIIPRFDEYGALTAHISSEIVAMVLAYYFVHRLIPFRISFFPFLKMIIATFAMVAVLLPLQTVIGSMHYGLVLLISAVIGGCVYGALLLILKAIPIHEIRQIFLKR